MCFYLPSLKIFIYFILSMFRNWRLPPLNLVLLSGILFGCLIPKNIFRNLYIVNNNHLTVVQSSMIHIVPGTPIKHIGHINRPQLINSPPPYHIFNQFGQPLNVTIHQPSKIVKSFHIDYSKKIGEGNYSCVYPVFDSLFPTSPPLVAKIIDMQRMKNQNLMNLVMNQIEIMQSTHHEAIINCREVIMEQNWCYIIMDFCEGGSLDHYIKAHNYHVPENFESIRFIKQLLDGMIYLQSKKIIHRDIKAANILFKDSHPIIADFGFGRYLNGSNFIHDINLGSLPYMAPQSLLDSNYCSKTDVWAFGILIYEIFHGESPYAKSHNIPELKEKVLTPLYLTSPLFRHDLSVPLRQLILICLTIDLDFRPEFHQVKESQCFRQLCQLHLSSQYYCTTNHLERSPTEFYSPYQQSDYLTPKKIPSTQKCASERNNSFKPFEYGSQRNISDSRRMNDRFSQRLTQEKTVSVENEKPTRQTNSASPFAKISFGKALRAGHLNNKSNDEKVQQNSPIPPALSNLGKKNSGYEKGHKSETERESKENIRSLPMLTFKEILLEIQQSRDYYKLAINLKNSMKKSGIENSSQRLREEKLNKIKERMILRAYQKINEVQELIQNDRVNYGVSPQEVRKEKVSSVVADYKQEFKKQIKKRDLDNRLNKYELAVVVKTPSFIKLSSAKHLESDMSEQEYEQNYNKLLEQDLKSIQNYEIGDYLDLNMDENNSTSTGAYIRKIKGFIDDLRELKSNRKFHREV